VAHRGEAQSLPDQLAAELVNTETENSGQQYHERAFLGHTHSFSIYLAKDPRTIPAFTQV